MKSDCLNVEPVKVCIKLLIILGFFVCSSCDIDVWSGESIPDPLPEDEILKGFPVIDVHQHIYNSSNFWNSGYDHIPLREYLTAAAHYEALVQRMNDNHVVLALAGSTLEAIDYFFTSYPENRSLFWYSAEYMQIEAATLEITLSDLRLAIEEQKIRAFGELTGIYDGLPFDDPGFMALYELADSASLPVFIHTGIVPESIYGNIPTYAFELSNPLYMDEILKKYPEVNFNAAHFGISNRIDYDFEDDVIEMLKAHENLYVDIGATIWWSKRGARISEAFMERAIGEGLEDRILFASDEMVWPDALTAAVNYVKRADFLTDTIKKKILYWNAARYLKLSEEEIAVHFGK